MRILNWSNYAMPHHLLHWEFVFPPGRTHFDLHLTSNMPVDVAIVLPRDVPNVYNGFRPQFCPLWRGNTFAVAELIELPDEGPWALALANHGAAPALVQLEGAARRLWPVRRG